MAKKAGSNNKYGLASFSFNQPGFSLAMPKVNLVEKKAASQSSSTTKKPTGGKAAANLPKAKQKVVSVKGQDKAIARKPTMMKKAGRSK